MFTAVLYTQNFFFSIQKTVINRRRQPKLTANFCIVKKEIIEDFNTNQPLIKTMIAFFQKGSYAAFQKSTASSKSSSERAA